jgi:hypothetical protein
MLICLNLNKIEGQKQFEDNSGNTCRSTEELQTFVMNSCKDRRSL